MGAAITGSYQGHATFHIWMSHDTSGNRHRHLKKIVQDISASDMLCMTKVIACLRAGVIAEYLSREKVWKDEV